MSEAENVNSPRLCPAVLMPILEFAKENGGTAFYSVDIDCHCEAGPQRRNLQIGNLILPIKDPRAGKFVCGKALEEL